jgi:hypothetical protein
MAADNYTYTGADGGAWEDSGNWSGENHTGDYPGFLELDSAIIPGNDIPAPPLSDRTIADFTVVDDSGLYASMAANDWTRLTVNGAMTIPTTAEIRAVQKLKWGASSSLTFTGTAQLTVLLSSGTAPHTITAPGALLISGQGVSLSLAGTITVGGSLTIVADYTGANGTIDLAGGTLVGPGHGRGVPDLRCKPRRVDRWQSNGQRLRTPVQDRRR